MRVSSSTGRLRQIPVSDQVTKLLLQIHTLGRGRTLGIDTLLHRIGQPHISARAPPDLVLHPCRRWVPDGNCWLHLQDSLLTKRPLPGHLLRHPVGVFGATPYSEHSRFADSEIFHRYFFIVVAPVFFSAAIYTILSIMITAVGKQYAPFPPKAILWIFIVCDVIATGVQVGK